MRAARPAPRRRRRAVAGRGRPPGGRGGAAAAMLVPGPGGAEPHMGRCLAGGGAEVVSAERLPAPARRSARSASRPDGGGACCFSPRCPQVSGAARRLARPGPFRFALRQRLPPGGRGAGAVNGQACSEERAALSAAPARCGGEGRGGEGWSRARALAVGRGGRSETRAPPPAGGRCRRGAVRCGRAGGRGRAALDLAAPVRGGRTRAGGGPRPPGGGPAGPGAPPRRGTVAAALRLSPSVRADAAACPCETGVGRRCRSRWPPRPAAGSGPVDGVAGVPPCPGGAGGGGGVGAAAARTSR